MDYFDIEQAKVRVLDLLEKEEIRLFCIKEKYFKKGNSVEGLFPNECYDKIDLVSRKIRNIERIRNNKILEKLVDIFLIRDIYTIIQGFKCSEDEIVPNENVLLSCFFWRTSVCAKGLRIGNNFQYFSDEEELRRYLYELVDFEFQYKDETLDICGITDPMALDDFSPIMRPLKLLVDLDLIKKYKTPKHVKREKKI